MDELSILIVEDDEVAAEILQQFILQHRSKAKVEWCWNGFEALVKVQEIEPDLVFLDYMMPKLDGMEFIAALKELQACKKSYITVISAYVDESKEKEFLQMGVDEVLSKPINIEQIGAVLDKVGSLVKA